MVGFPWGGRGGVEMLGFDKDIPSSSLARDGAEMRADEGLGVAAR